ncbi:MAG: SMUG2 DNA glycosylase family protein [Bacteroidetes bacterium]|nr:SMUG2 DNA glycosylase family protein [Bacteroidota bacterium]
MNFGLLEQYDKSEEHQSFADKMISFNSRLSFCGALPNQVRVMNPFQSNSEILPVSSIFYRKYYNDRLKRIPILGINPGRNGAGATGIPFTDSLHLWECCGLKIESVSNRELSSIFIYDLIEKMGGPQVFYRQFYINSICPLGLVQKNNRGNWVNCNYYDSSELIEGTKPFIIASLKQQISLGLNTDFCYSLGKKNATILEQINKEYRFFKTIIPLEHPRYIQQYKRKERADYLEDFVKKLSLALAFQVDGDDYSPGGNALDSIGER